VFLDLYKRKNGQSVGGGTTVASGPLVVTKSNIGKVSAAIAAGQD
jgi:nucleoside phosphorylase